MLRLGSLDSDSVEPPYDTTDLHFLDATAPPPSESNFDPGDHLPLASGSRSHYGVNIVRIAQDAIAQIDATRATQTTSNQLVHPSQYCKRFGRPVPSMVQSVVSRLESGDLHVRIVVNHDDTLKSIKSQIANQKSIFERKGYPYWSKDIIGADRDFNDHPWCHLVFRDALESNDQSMRSELIDLFTAYNDAQRSLDIGAIQHLPEYVQVLKSLDQIHERVQRYGMCSTQYQVTITAKSGLYKTDYLDFTAGIAGCTMTPVSPNEYRSKDGRTAPEIVVWPPPASGRLLRRSPQIVKLQVAKEIVASKFQDLELRDVEDLGLEKLNNADLKLLLNTPRFANGAAMLAHKFQLGNHITGGFMSNLARHWLLCTAETNEMAFKHLLLIPDRTSLDLVRVMMAAVDLVNSDQVRTLCLELSAKKHVWECCEAIASAAVPYGITARARLCLECLDPAVMNAVRNAQLEQTRAHDTGVLKYLLGFAGGDMWKLRINTFLHILEIGATDYSAALHADQVDSIETAKKIEQLTRYLKHSNMRRSIINASRRLQDLELYVQMLNSEQLPESAQYTTLLMRLINAAGYSRVAELNVPIEPRIDRQIVSSWLLSGPSDGLCISGEIYVKSGLELRNIAPSRDVSLLGKMTGQARLSEQGLWEFFQGTRKEETFDGIWPWSALMATRTIAIWKTLRENEKSEQSHAHLSEQVYFHANENELPNARGLSLLTLERDGVGDLVGRGLTITPRIAKDIWHLDGCVYYSMSRGSLWKKETEGASCYAIQADKLSRNFLVMSRGGLQGMMIS